MTKRLMTVIGLVLAAALYLCPAVMAGDWFGFGKDERGSGDLASETRDLKPFSRIELDGSIDLHITLGEDQSVVVEGDDNLLDNVYTEVTSRGELKVGVEEPYRSRRGLLVEITLPGLERVEIDGSGDVTVLELDQEQFEVRISGSGDADIEGRATSIEVYVAGSGDVDLRGDADEVFVKVRGSGDVDARRLTSKEATVTIQGSGDVKVHATEYFDGTVNGSGDITYYGDPEDVSKNVHGSGDIRRR